jgi:DNA-binding NarL/FixJ family response regulator
LTRLDALMIGDILLPAGLAERMLQVLVGRPDAPEEVLNDRQMAILRLMAQRLTYAQIGERLHLSESTIKHHTAQIIEKMHVNIVKIAKCEHNYGREPFPLPNDEEIGAAYDQG